MGVHDPRAQQLRLRDAWTGKLKLAYHFFLKQIKVELAFRHVGWPELIIYGYPKLGSRHTPSGVQPISRNTYVLLYAPREQKIIDALSQQCSQSRSLDTQQTPSQTKELQRRIRQGLLSCTTPYHLLIADCEEMTRDLKNLAFAKALEKIKPSI